MSLRKPFALLAATMFAAFQGCQSSQVTAPTGDRSSEGTGAVAFRLSQQNVEFLRTQALYLEFIVTGPGMDTMRGSTILDTAPIRLDGIPCGTRAVLVQAVDPAGVASWSGSDTVEIDYNQTTLANIVLRRPVRRGNLLIDISLDSASSLDSAIPFRFMDTVWTSRTSTGWAYDSYDYCETPVLVGSTNRFRVDCHHMTVLPIPGDTVWADTFWRTPNQDTTDWCYIQSVDSLTQRGTYRCYRPHYLPYVKRDTLWQDSTVGTKSLDKTTWCHPSFWSSDSNVYCFTGRYKKLPVGTCERVSYDNGFPQGARYNCADSASLWRSPSDS
ncbi:MAG: hypothetical protein IPN71_01115 [Fibrobacteres bacterium]|nr:hypothetical protein [Fibrobacterota bacterium]